MAPCEAWDWGAMRMGMFDADFDAGKLFVPPATRADALEAVATGRAKSSVGSSELAKIEAFAREFGDPSEGRGVREALRRGAVLDSDSEEAKREEEAARQAVAEAWGVPVEEEGVSALPDSPTAALVASFVSAAASSAKSLAASLGW